MNIKEELSKLTDEQIEQLWKFLQDYDCSGINCQNCVFRCDNTKCLFVLVEDEYFMR